MTLLLLTVTVVCAAMGQGGSSNLFTPEGVRALRSGARVKFDGTTLLSGFDAVDLHDGIDLEGRNATCVLTSRPWNPEYADSSRLEISLPRRVVVKL